ncbi:MAG: hypothetical protein KC668_03035 [Myxococcales bacterium]|nr:hypothetical protein [Myxococcales bacterium]
MAGRLPLGAPSELAVPVPVVPVGHGDLTVVGERHRHVAREQHARRVQRGRLVQRLADTEVGCLVHGARDPLRELAQGAAEGPVRVHVGGARGLRVVHAQREHGAVQLGARGVPVGEAHGGHVLVHHQEAQPLGLGVEPRGGVHEPRFVHGLGCGERQLGFQLLHEVVRAHLVEHGHTAREDDTHIVRALLPHALHAVVGRAGQLVGDTRAVGARPEVGSRTQSLAEPAHALEALGASRDQGGVLVEGLAHRGHRGVGQRVAEQPAAHVEREEERHGQRGTQHDARAGHA